MTFSSKSCFSGNEEDFIMEYSRLVRRVIRPFFLKGGDYDDLYQEGMIGLLKAIRSYDSSRSPYFEPFASVCIRNRILDAIRAQKGEMQPYHLATDQWQVFAECSADNIYTDPEAEVLANETAKEIEKTLSGLLSAFEASVLDPYLEGYTASEIAGHLRCPAKSVDNAIRRIRRKLAHYLSQGDSRNHPVRIKPTPRYMGTKER